MTTIKAPHQFKSFAETFFLRINENIIGFEIKPVREIPSGKDETECAWVSPDELEEGLIPDFYSVYARVGNITSNMAQLMADCPNEKSAKELVAMLNLSLKNPNRYLPDISAIEMNLNTLDASCNEAITGEWDKSDQGFIAMQESIEEIRTEIKKMAPPVIYHVRPPYPWSGIESIHSFEDPNIISAASFHDLIYKLRDMGILVTQEENLMTNGDLIIDVSDMEKNESVYPIIFEWYFEDEEKNENFEKEGD